MFPRKSREREIQRTLTVAIPQFALPHARFPMKSAGLPDGADVMSDLTNANITVTLGIQTSPDGTTWTTKVQNEHWLGFAANNTGADNARQCQIDLMLQSGADLGVLAGDASLKVRGIIKADKAGASLSHPTGSGAENGVGSAHIMLEELF